MATVHIPTPMRRLMDGQARIDLEAATVGDLVRALVARHPSTRRLLLDASGDGISRFVGVFVNGEDCRGHGGADVELTTRDRVDLLLPVAGG